MSRSKEGSACEGSTRSGSPFLALLIFLVTLGLGLWTYPSYLGLRPSRDGVALAALGASLPSSFSPLRILILPSPPGSIRLRLKALDLDGRELSLLELGFQGQGLGLDCIARKLGAAPKGGAARTILFPKAIFGYGESALEADRVLLFDAYDRGGLPGIYLGGRGAPSQAPGEELAAQTKALARLFSSAKADTSPSSLVHILMPSLEQGAAYELRVSGSAAAGLVKVEDF